MSASRTVLALVAAVPLAAGIYAAFRMESRRSADEITPIQTGQITDQIHDDVYPDPARAGGDLANALAQGAREKKHVIVDFGGNWCPDCKILDFYFHNATNLPILDRNYILVHINIGRYDLNRDLAAKYGIPLNKGVPALAVLNSDGGILYSQRDGEFEAMRGMDPSSVTEFLEKWKP